MGTGAIIFIYVMAVFVVLGVLFLFLKYEAYFKARKEAKSLAASIENGEMVEDNERKQKRK